MSTTRTPIQVDYKLPVNEMTNAQIKKVIGVVSRHFDVDAEEFFGMPYTSSSAFAGLWNTNVEETIAGNRSVQGFTHEIFGDISSDLKDNWCDDCQENVDLTCVAEA